MKPTTIALLQKCKQEKKRFATITAYDHSFAKLFADEALMCCWWAIPWE